MEPHIGLSAEQRQAIVASLNKLQADSSMLYMKTHGFHWNVTGPHFTQLHELFESQYTEIWQSIDEIAERIRALGELALGSYKEMIGLSCIEGAAPGLDWKSMVAQLVEGNEAVVRTARECHAVASKAGDEATIDLLTRRTLEHEKNAWMLRSLLE